MYVQYTSNNSGGSWWLNDEQWKQLENAGWEVEWLKERWLGALAKYAKLKTDKLALAIESFEQATGLRANEPGCSCCGQPHWFSLYDDSEPNHRYIEGGPDVDEEDGES